jgi:SPP1 family phage portal protein
MDILKLKELISKDPIDKVADLIETRAIIKKVDDAIKQFNPKKHAVTDTSIRQDKPIYGEDVEDPNKPGKFTRGPVINTVKIARLTIPIQKNIVGKQVAFLGAPVMKATPRKNGIIKKVLGSPQSKEEDYMQILNKVWDDNKLDFKTKKIFRHVLSEKHAAELWYMPDATEGYWKDYPINQKAKYKLGIKILAPSLGDELFPIFDDTGDMIAFARRYKLTDDDGKEILNIDIYTADRFYFCKQIDGQWAMKGESKEYITGYTGGIKNVLGKIPIIYGWVPITAWEDVQPLIERLEVKISNHADTNDYFDQPVLVGKGKTISLPNKGETGKYVEIEGDGAELKYLTWDQAPESMKMEIDNLQKFINQYTSTPDISFESMKGLGVFSGIALKMLFLDAHLKAAENEEVFGEMMQRRINFLKVAVAKIDTSFEKCLTLTIKPKFTYFLPENTQELISTLVQATNGGLMSKETAIRANTLLSDPDAEIEAIKTEQAEADKREAAKAKNSLVPVNN